MQQRVAHVSVIDLKLTASNAVSYQEINCLDDSAHNNVNRLKRDVSLRHRKHKNGQI
jgi:hypothetical protein